MNKNLKITLSVDAKTGEVTAVRNSFDKLERKVSKTNNALSGTKKILSGLAIGALIKELISYADAFTSLDTKIKLVTNSLRERKAVEFELLKVSNDARVSYESTADLYNRIARSSKDLKYTHKDLLEVTQNIAKSLTISGDNAESADAALMQLGQGLASGTLRGEELNSVMEQTPRLAQAIADGMGISIGELRKVAEQGKLTSKAVIEAISSQTDALNAEFKDIAPTIAQSMTIAENSFLSVMGAVDDTTGASTTLAETISGISGFIVEHTDDIAQGFLGIKLVFQILKQDFWQVVVWIDEGLGSIGQGWNNLTAGMQNAWKTSIDTIGKMYYDVVNYILKLVSDTVNKISSSLGGAFEFIGVDNPFEPINLSIGKYVSSVKEAKAETYEWAGTDWAKSKLNESAKSVYETYTKLQEGVHVALKSDQEALNSFVKGANKKTKTINKQTQSLNEAKKAAEAYAKGLEKAQERLRDARLFNAGGDELVQIAKLGDELAGLGKYLKQSELAEIYEAEIAKMKQSTDSLADKLQEALGIKNDDLFSDLFSGMMDGLKSIGSAVKSGDSMAIADSFGQMRLKALDMVMPGLGSLTETLTSFIGGKLSEAEIKAAAGRSGDDIKSQGTAQIVETLKKYQDPQLTATKQMLHHLESMDKNLLSALASSASLDLSGSNFTPKTSSILGGFISASTTELIGSGIKFYDQAVSGFVEGVNADKYESIKKSSSILGIFHSENVKEKTSELSGEVAKQLGQAFQDGLDAATTAIDTLGFDTEKFKQSIQNYIISIGKINLKDMSAEEQAKAINRALTEQLNGAVSSAINSIASPENISKLNSLRLAGEEYTQSLVRIATEHETVRQQLALFGQTVTDFATSDALVQAAGGLDKFKSAMSTFVHSFFTEGEQKQFLAQQLQYALQVHNVALPASKAQFKALVLETQQKIINVKATISALKAEIAAKVAAGQMTIAQAYGELQAKGQIAQAQAEVIKGQVRSNNFLIRSSHEAGKASVGFGKSVHQTVKAMAGAAAQAAVEGAETAVDAAGNIDYSKITSPAIAAAQAELKNLEGLYGTLMSNMGQFSEYYNDAGSAASGAASAAESAAEKFTKLQRSLIAIAELKAVWTGDDISAKKIILDATKRITGLQQLTYENFLSEFEKATASGLGMDDKTLRAWQDMSSALRALHDAEEKRIEQEKSKVRKDIAFYENILTQIDETFTGSLSSLFASEKADYAAKRAVEYQRDGDKQSYIKMLQVQLQNEKRMSATKEEYERSLIRYREELRSQRPESIDKKQLESLEELNARLARIEDILDDEDIIYNPKRRA